MLFTMRQSGPLFKRMTIIGVGLIGGSLGLKCKLEGLVGEVVGVGRGVRNLEDALSLRAIDSYTHDAAQGVKGADLVVLATPVGSFASLVAVIRPHLKRDALVTDVGSVKGALIDMLEENMPSGVRFVGGHPIAGKEAAGAAHSDPALFNGKRCILTPTSKTDPDALGLVAALWKGVGSEVTFMDPYMHDSLLAITSHLPQLAAYSLVRAVEDLCTENPEARENFGAGFRDTTRLASSPPEMWRDICLYNSAAILTALKKFEEVLKEVEVKVAQGDGEALMGIFEGARSYRDALLERSEEKLSQPAGE